MRLRSFVVRKLGVVVLTLAGLGGSVRADAAVHPLRVDGGVLTVDGFTVKTGVDLRIANFRYLYVGVPGFGTAVVSERPFAGAEEERAAFRGNLLTVTADGRKVQLTAANRMRGTHSAYVLFMPGGGTSLRKATVSYGDAAMTPAVWGGAPMERVPVRRVRVRGARAPRTAKLCRPSRKGHEACALIREVVWRSEAKR
jgi:hypothetical protein